MRRLGLKFGALPSSLQPQLLELFKAHEESAAAQQGDKTAIANIAEDIAEKLPGGWSVKQVRADGIYNQRYARRATNQTRVGASAVIFVAVSECLRVVGCVGRCAQHQHRTLTPPLAAAAVANTLSRRPVPIKLIYISRADVSIAPLHPPNPTPRPHLYPNPHHPPPPGSAGEEAAAGCWAAAWWPWRAQEEGR